VSFERAVDAAVALLVERRSDSFTLAEVAERAGVSIGSIYGRVDSKDDLLRAAHAREMARIADEQGRAFGGLRPVTGTLEATVTVVVRTLAELLRDNAQVLAPFMEMARHDRVIAESGKAAHGSMVDGFCSILLTRRDDIRHREPERAVAWSCTVVYSVMSRWLGLGDAGEAAEEGEWDSILADLSEMVTSFLLRSNPVRHRSSPVPGSAGIVSAPI
jgi:AcrR family transcriptional regulator